jgi:hypothetical protein
VRSPMRKTVKPTFFFFFFFEKAVIVPVCGRCFSVRGFMGHLDKQSIVRFALK